MFTKRIKSATIAAAASGAVVCGLLALAGPASAANTPSTTGATIGNTHAAGYEASGRNFRYIRAVVPVPDDSLAFIDQGLYPQSFIQLSDGSTTIPAANGGADYARAGIESCDVANSLTGYNCPGGTDWVSYVEIYDNSLNFPFVAHYTPLQNVSPGDGVTFSIYENVQGNELFFTINPPTPNGGTPVPGGTYKTQAYGDIFSHAAVLDDFTDSTGTPIALPPLVNSFDLTTFNAIAITTNGGIKGSMTGSWTTSQVVATSNGNLPPYGAERAWPTPLTSDGISSNGAVRSNDAFDIWAR